MKNKKTYILFIILILLATGAVFYSIILQNFSGSKNDVPAAEDEQPVQEAITETNLSTEAVSGTIEGLDGDNLFVRIGKEPETLKISEQTFVYAKSQDGIQKMSVADITRGKEITFEYNPKTKTAISVRIDK